MKASHVPIITGIVLAAAFIGIALSILLFRESFPAAARPDLTLYAALTGAYGVWRSIRVYLFWKAEKNNI
ncbi:MAG: hypothetical protein HGA70_07085 [Chlorobiaceae bacterium]|nr:hypothetical protein [Chlorobiaceae bacterium]NTW10055.1 hypothetical protein [Chlorobiaceae bacterium]